MDWEDLGFMFGGDLISAYADRQAARRRQEMLNLSHQYGLNQAAKSRASIDEYLARFSPEARERETADLRSEVAANLEKGMGVVQPFSAPQDFAGKVSEDYTRAKANATGAAQARVKKAMENLAVMGTPAVRAVADRPALNDASADVALANQAAARARAHYAGTMETVRPDAFTNFIGQVLRGVGQAGVTSKKTRRPAATGFYPGAPTD